MMDLHSFVFKCAHALLKRTVEGFFFLFSPPLQHPHYWYNSYHSYLVLLLQRHQELYFSGACQIISTASTLNASQPNSFLLSLSGTVELLLSLGSCFSLWFGSSGWLSQRNKPDPLLFPAHTCLCVCPCWGHLGRTVGVMRSQTALNGPKQAAQINNLLRLKSSHQEQHSVKCQQQTP